MRNNKSCIFIKKYIGLIYHCVCFLKNAAINSPQTFASLVMAGTAIIMVFVTIATLSANKQMATANEQMVNQNQELLNVYRMQNEHLKQELALMWQQVQTDYAPLIDTAIVRIDGKSYIGQTNNHILVSVVLNTINRGKVVAFLEQQTVSNVLIHIETEQGEVVIDSNQASSFGLSLNTSFVAPNTVLFPGETINVTCGIVFPFSQPINSIKRVTLDIDYIYRGIGLDNTKSYQTSCTFEIIGDEAHVLNKSLPFHTPMLPPST